MRLRSGKDGTTNIKACPTCTRTHHNHDAEVFTAQHSDPLLQQEVQSFIRERLGIADRNMKDWPIVDRMIVKAASNPKWGKNMLQSSHLALDWENHGATKWAISRVAILSQEFCIGHQSGAFPTIRHLQPTTACVYRMVKEYVLHLKREYHSGVPRAVHIARRRAMADKRFRSIDRRRQLLRRRKMMVKHHVSPNVATEILEALGKAGMSSEESDGEPGAEKDHWRLFRIKQLPWRSTELTEWLHRLDRMPTKNASGAVLTKIPPYRNRFLSDLESQARPPVKGLPRSFYRTDWLRQQSQQAVEGIEVSAFDVALPEIGDFTPK